MRNTSGSGERRDSEEEWHQPLNTIYFLKQKSKTEQNIDADALGPQQKSVQRKITDFFKKLSPEHCVPVQCKI